MHIANQNKRIEEMCKRINVCPKRAYDKKLLVQGQGA